ncbi:MAG: hypothetical protein ACO20F_10235 [Robiginitalea sp.]|jgi:hypothetical protein
MEAIKKLLKAIALLLCVLLLFQSCVVYHKTPVTLEKAAQENVRSKVWFLDEVQDFPSKYKYIVYENDHYFGLEEIEVGMLSKVKLSEDEIVTIRTQDKQASTWATIGLCTIGFGALIAGLVTTIGFSGI